MSDRAFDQDAWLARVGYTGPRAATLESLQALVAAHSTAIAYESIDVLLDRPPKLDLVSLQAKMIAAGRGGYWLRAEHAFSRRSAIPRLLRIDLSEGAYLADVGFGNLAPTAALNLTPLVQQNTPHEVMRFIVMGEELVLQCQGDRWEHIYRVVLLPRFDTEYEICNWFTGTHPQSPYLNTSSQRGRVQTGPGLPFSMHASMFATHPVRSSGELCKARRTIAVSWPTCSV